ncbi:immunoglobulin alpha-2 heavy chain-like isoform X2 [Ornithorhynchus anatinus]|uniref:immunoglobulin alpha-2 heavy chain-like isoform X2 n=1 Tax=Ornithorhynchus anatinus TaxID=9258 RepID=UPI0019D42E32|nr:immunoglobulin alpha-2 heavy chain-like isoform X2 [Ornithorhynchus anatinus]
MASRLCLILLPLPALLALQPPFLHQPQPSVVSGQGNPQIQCRVEGGVARIYVLSWYYQRPGMGPTFLLSLREGATPTYGTGVSNRFLAGLDVEKNTMQLTLGNAGPKDVGIYYCALWHGGQYIFGAGTQFIYQARKPLPPLKPPQLLLLTPTVGSPPPLLCVARGHYPSLLRISWTLGDKNPHNQRPRGPREMTVTCTADHESMTVEVRAKLPSDPDQGCKASLEHLRNGTQEGSSVVLMARLESILSAAVSIYLGLLGVAGLSALLLVSLLGARGHRFRRPAQPTAGPPRRQRRGANEARPRNDRSRAQRGGPPARSS